MMPTPPTSPPTKRVDAERNRAKILQAARAAFADPTSNASMAEISRRAGVGMATLYRNFPGRRELLEAIYRDEVDALCDAATHVEAEGPGAAFEAWLRRFVVFFTSKHEVATELLTHIDADADVFDNGRHRVHAAGRPLLHAAQRAGEIRGDMSLEQMLELVVAIAAIRTDAQSRDAILRAALDGLRTVPQ